MEKNNTTQAIERAISDAFRNAFEAHPQRETDPVLALDSARETASELVPDGVAGTFDDESLTFKADSKPEPSELVESTYYVRDEGGAGEDLGAFDSEDEAWEAAVEWAEDGDWPADGALVNVSLYRDYGTEREQHLGYREVAIPADVEALDPHGREHSRRGHEHSWERPEWLGGCRENPGVWSRGGTTMAYHSVCACGCRLHEVRYGSQRNPGQVDTQEYEYPDGLWPWGEDCTEVPEDPSPSSEE